MAKSNAQTYKMLPRNGGGEGMKEEGRWVWGSTLSPAAASVARPMIKSQMGTLESCPNCSRGNYDSVPSYELKSGRGGGVASRHKSIRFQFSTFAMNIEIPFAPSEINDCQNFENNFICQMNFGRNKSQIKKMINIFNFL